MRFDSNGGGSVYYEPNSFGGPKETPQNKPAAFEVTGYADSVAYDHDDHYTQAGNLYRLMSEEERARQVQNIAGAMSGVQKEEIKLRQIEHFYKADPEYGQRVAEALGLTVQQEE